VEAGWLDKGDLTGPATLFRSDHEVVQTVSKTQVPLSMSELNGAQSGVIIDNLLGGRGYGERR
jgi:hypothetical protein